MRLPAALSFGICIALGGCQSKQARLEKTKADYNAAYKKYFDDCVEPSYGAKSAGAALKGSAAKPISSEQEQAQQKRCADEAKRAGDLQMQLQSEQQ